MESIAASPLSPSASSNNSVSDHLSNMFLGLSSSKKTNRNGYNENGPVDEVMRNPFDKQQQADKDHDNNNDNHNNNNNNTDHPSIAFDSRKSSFPFMTQQRRRQPQNSGGKLVSVDDFLAVELNQLTINEREEIIQTVNETGAETDEHLSLAKELNKMSLKEREHILHDIHGVAETVKETPKLIESGLTQLQDAIRKECGGSGGGGGGPSSSSSKSSSSHAYDLAASMSPDYVSDNKLRLMFLRVTQFDSEAAARRLLEFFNLKLELFGPEKLCRDIQIEDLSKEDIECLETGHMQLLPSRDQAGRAIMAYLAPFIPANKNGESIQRAQFYQIMTWLRDEESQQNGFVIVLYRCAFPQFQPPPPRVIWKNATSFQILPFMIRSWHLCAVGYNMGFLWPTRWLLEKKTRIRTRIHQGSHVECMYHLMTFGIPIRTFPVSDDVEMKTETHLRWVESMKRLEDIERSKKTTKPSETTPTTGYSGNDRIDRPQRQQQQQSQRGAGGGGRGKGVDAASDRSDVVSSSSSSSSSPPPHVIVVPSRKDILFGRGKPIQEHPGNIRLGVILESVFDRYEALKRSEKTNLAQEVVLKVKSMGGRFLRQVDAVWEEVDDDKAREKVSHTFRSLRSAASKPVKKSNKGKKKKVGDDETTVTSEDGDGNKRTKVASSAS